LSCFIAFGLVYMMIGHNYSDLAKLRPTWMVPVITLITMSASGGLFTRSLLPHSRELALVSASVSLIMLAIGLSFTMMLTTSFLLRLYLHGPLDATIVLSTFTTLTPLGQGGFSMLMNGQDIANLFAANDVSTIMVAGTGMGSQLGGEIVFSLCICGAYVLWSMGLAWVAVACFSICRRARTLPRFAISHWCVVVPNGVYASLSLQLGTVLDSAFFTGFGATWACVVFVLWAIMFCRSVVATVDGSIFAKPGSQPAVAAAAVVVVAAAAPTTTVVALVDQPGDKHVESVVSSLQASPELKVHDIEAMVETLGYHQDLPAVKSSS
jgi:tellurite resistance protein TehA-like permease